jgi:hypothetical protein
MYTIRAYNDITSMYSNYFKYIYNYLAYMKC